MDSLHFCSISLLLAPAQPPHQRPAPKPGDRVRAKQILEWMKAGEYGKVIDQLDSSAAAKLDTAKLSSVWNNMLRNAGPFREVQSTTDEQQPGYTMVIQRCLFGEKSIDFKLVLAETGKSKVFSSSLPIQRSDTNCLLTMTAQRSRSGRLSLKTDRTGCPEH